MKSKKLNLDSISVKSFVTDLKKDNSQTINGGTGAICTSSTWNIYTLVMFGCGGGGPSDMGGNSVCTGCDVQ